MEKNSETKIHIVMVEDCMPPYGVVGTGRTSAEAFASAWEQVNKHFQHNWISQEHFFSECGYRAEAIKPGEGFTI